MIVTLTRAADPGPLPGEWQAVDLAIGRGVLFGCPFCRATGIIGPPPPVTRDGMVLSLVSCSSGKCEYAFQVFLAGWPDVNRVAEPRMQGGV